MITKFVDKAAYKNSGQLLVGFEHEPGQYLFGLRFGKNINLSKKNQIEINYNVTTIKPSSPSTSYSNSRELFSGFSQHELRAASLLNNREESQQIVQLVAPIFKQKMDEHYLDYQLRIISLLFIFILLNVTRGPF
jgi:hypothetical protein